MGSAKRAPRGCKRRGGHQPPARTSASTLSSAGPTLFASRLLGSENRAEAAQPLQSEPAGTQNVRVGRVVLANGVSLGRARPRTRLPFVTAVNFHSSHYLSSLCSAEVHGRRPANTSSFSIVALASASANDVTEVVHALDQRAPWCTRAACPSSPQRRRAACPAPYHDAEPHARLGSTRLPPTAGRGVLGCCSRRVERARLAGLLTERRGTLSSYHVGSGPLRKGNWRAACTGCWTTSVPASWDGTWRPTLDVPVAVPQVPPGGGSSRPRLDHFAGDPRMMDQHVGK